jgi:phosphohistidine phosphatase
MSALKLYLIRHEEAEPGYDIPDGHRALTGKGRQRMHATGKLVREHADIDLVYTSPLVRAVQTAEILVDELGFDEPVLARGVIASPPSLRALIALIDGVTADVRGLAIVGHEPTLSELSAELLALPAYPRTFKKGSVLALDYQRGQGKATFRWLIVGKGPSLLSELEA